MCCVGRIVGGGLWMPRPGVHAASSCDLCHRVYQNEQDFRRRQREWWSKQAPLVSFSVLVLLLFFYVPYSFCVKVSLFYILHSYRRMQCIYCIGSPLQASGWPGGEQWHGGPSVPGDCEANNSRGASVLHLVWEQAGRRGYVGLHFGCNYLQSVREGELKHYRVS